MTALLDIPVAEPTAGADAAGMRAALRAQIARLEAELPPGPGRGGRRGAALVPVEELERIRDDLAWRVREDRFDGGDDQERARRLREEMWLDPAAHRGVTISNGDVGEPGCTRWASWFRLTVSSGCP